MKTILSNRLATTATDYKDYLNNPFDPDLVHTLRVSIRKLRALFNFIKKELPKEDYQAINGLWREMGRILSPVREYDVLIETCAEIARDNPDMSSDYFALFQFLRLKRLQAMRKSLRLLDDDVFAETEIVIDAIEDKDWNAFLTKRFAKKDKKLEERYESLDFDDYEAIHDLRKDAKKVRYAAKDFGELTDYDTKSSAKQAKSIQRELGDLTDDSVNVYLLGELAKESKKLSDLLLQMKEIIEEK